MAQILHFTDENTLSGEAATYFHRISYIRNWDLNPQLLVVRNSGKPSLCCCVDSDGGLVLRVAQSRET